MAKLLSVAAPQHPDMARTILVGGYDVNLCVRYD